MDATNSNLRHTGSQFCHLSDAPGRFTSLPAHFCLLRSPSSHNLAFQGYAEPFGSKIELKNVGKSSNTMIRTSAAKGIPLSCFDTETERRTMDQSLRPSPSLCFLFPFTHGQFGPFILNYVSNCVTQKIFCRLNTKGTKARDLPTFCPLCRRRRVFLTSKATKDTKGRSTGMRQLI